jgi:hypothetical protein
VAGAFLAHAGRLTAAYRGRSVGPGVGGPVVTTMLAVLTLAALVWPASGLAPTRAVARCRRLLPQPRDDASLVVIPFGTSITAGVGSGTGDGIWRCWAT